MRRLCGLFAALVLGGGAGLVFAAGPAAAAACPQGQGITVVVGSSISCDADAGSPASENFRDAGHTLTPVDRQPGFVCKVDGAPNTANCVNTPPGDAYWGLFWSDGTSGRWVYASQGAYSLKVPAGGWVAFVFQKGGDRVAPGVTPIGPAPAKPPAAKATKTPATKKPAATKTTKPAAKPTSAATKATTPSAKPTSEATKPGATPTASAGAPGASASPSAATPSTPATAEESAAAASADESDGTKPTSESVDSSDGSGSLGWVAGAIVVALLAGMGGVLWRRKAAGGPS